MTILYVLIPVALGMGAVALIAFIWSLQSGQYDDLAGAAERILIDSDEDAPLPHAPRAPHAEPNTVPPKETTS
ncbi:cbb3-type cytochrome oxidase assembly protein CcoS [Pikeienuella sp. HZG-20]|uniref:cbb3-type cytochrome oxidase assembly protein CcoS n=1 Tax=Paludibacillus litoralis TaxID=3133267 RepID=UPI0030EE7413